MGDNISYQHYGDYVQSANTLFHFMKRFEYLKTILVKRALVPRYCIESVEYLNMKNGNIDISQIAVLQKCFCDIPLHKLADTFSVVGTGESYDNLGKDEKYQILHNNTHFDLYGGFAIGFSKDWSERKKLQPIHYLNTQSSFSEHFKQLLAIELNSADLDDVYVDDILYRLAYIKPLRGIMQRNYKREREKETEWVTIDIYKNFHDECEWRFVPDHKTIEKMHLENVIANPKRTKDSELLKRINRHLEDDRYKTLWLRFNYDDIRYLIVPSNNDRISLIKAILEIPEQLFLEKNDIDLQKQVLISKILVLDEIRKDW